MIRGATVPGVKRVALQSLQLSGEVGVVSMIKRARFRLTKTNAIVFFGLTLQACGPCDLTIRFTCLLGLDCLIHFGLSFGTDGADAFCSCRQRHHKSPSILTKTSATHQLFITVDQQRKATDSGGLAGSLLMPCYTMNQTL